MFAHQCAAVLIIDIGLTAEGDLEIRTYRGISRNPSDEVETSLSGCTGMF